MTALRRHFAPGSHIEAALRRRLRRALLASALVLLAGAALGAPAQAAFSDFGIDSVSASLSTDQAGAHPDFATVIEIKTDPASTPDAGGALRPWARTRDVLVDLPAGLTGNPTAVPRCTAIQFATQYTGGGCPNASQVGVTVVRVYGAFPTGGFDPTWDQPIYNMQPPEGTVARLGFYVQSVPTMIDVEVRPERDYAVSASVEGVFAVGGGLLSATTTLWGVPADPVHDMQRQMPQEADGGASSSPPRPPGVAPAAFMINPTSCGGPLDVGFAADSYQDLGNFSPASAQMAAIAGCERLDFSPDISLVPTTRRADWPSGMDVKLSLPQEAITDPGGLAEAHLKKTVVTLPEGMALNPSAADGLEGCSTAQIGLISKAPIRFNSADPACPDGSKVGTAVIDTPLLPDPLEGSLYVADPDDNAFDTLLSGYLVAQGQGVLLKIAGRFDPDPVTGRIVATFDNNPQQPFDDVVLHFKGGDHGVVATPPACGVFGVRSVFTSWALPDRPDKEVVQDGSFSFDQGCGERPFAFDFEAGTGAAVAGASSPFAMRVSREGGTQRFKGVKVTLPPGLLAKIRGVPQCPEPQAAAGTCGPESQVGSVRAAAGAGNTPVWIPQPGKAPTRVYLAGPYKGAPFSLSVVVPAQAGPFDLGDVVVRVALFVDPVDAHVTAVSDQLPHILKGIPLNVRTMHVAADRAGFMRNPTDCSPLSVLGDFMSLEGSTRAVSSRFQVGDCANLRYRPRFRIRLTGTGQTRDGGHPGIVASARQRPGEAGIRQVKVALPLSLALDPDNAQGLCEYEDGLRLACPASSIIGQAEAVSPLLNEPLTGPVYFVKNVRIHPRTGRRIRTLPALLVTLTGENGVKINLRASSDVDDKARLVSTFSGLPDAPVSSFRMRLKGGKGGIIVVTHNKDVCRGKQTALAETDGHNSKRHDPKIKLATPCVKVGKPKPHGRTLRLPVRVPQAGTLRAGGGKSGLAKVTRRLAKAGKVTLTLKPTRAARRKLARRGSMRLRVPVRFTPRGTKKAQRTTSPTVTMRR